AEVAAAGAVAGLPGADALGPEATEALGRAAAAEARATGAEATGPDLGALGADEAADAPGEVGGQARAEDAVELRAVAQRAEHARVLGDLLVELLLLHLDLVALGLLHLGV